MDGLFEKLGLYDFFSMFMAGIISESIAVIVAYKCFGFDIMQIFDSTLMFLIIGYFIGLILHEIEGQAERILKNTFSRNVLSKEDYFFKNDCDKQMLKKVKVYILGDKKEYPEDDETYITSVCVNELQIKNTIASSDRLKTQSEMALSICISSAIIGIVALVAGIICHFVGEINILSIIVTAIVLPIISMIFFIRSKRMHRYYIRCLIRTYAVLNDLEK